MHSDSQRIRRSLTLARSVIDQQRPHAAHDLLKAVQHDINGLGDPLLVAEYRLLVAEAFAAVRDPAGEYAFQEAIELLRQIDPPPVEVLLRALEHYGNFLYTAHAPSKARKRYSDACQIATEERFAEDNARLRLKLELIDLETDKSPELQNFQTMKRVAKDRGFTCAAQLQVWLRHLGGIETANHGLRAARKRSVATDRYFEDLFQSMQR